MQSYRFELDILKGKRKHLLINWFSCLLGCGLKSHSVIFQLCSDGAIGFLSVLKMSLGLKIPENAILNINLWLFGFTPLYFNGRITPTHNADTLWCMQLDSKVIAELIPLNLFEIHKGESEY